MMDQEKNIGIFIEIEAENGWIEQVQILASNDQERCICEGVLARMVRPKVWTWLRKIFGN